MLFDEMDFFRDNARVTKVIEDAQELFGENTPYAIERRASGNIVIFNKHFINTVREALTTGCMAKMSAGEVEVFEKFIAYQNGGRYRDITQDNNDIMKALDKWLVREIRCEQQPVLNGCFDSVHTYTQCKV